ncbi:hypothetical protein IMZ31_19790 (plasmid) [Pontibacillus sp. ALD_SL1]|uniref:hypothetical protein n=1 Tax=Pontibacillus sp. ALD_SL1 TaxID=2777185 RepID=UPI001A964EC7|nr:hypothetical protein [Pontibacillus sp. ALD_SL1]QST02794.1 hypothetical protein IMZ31_19790 [Pontibacillus sp. ALD_SL1]
MNSTMKRVLRYNNLAFLVAGTGFASITGYAYVIAEGVGRYPVLQNLFTFMVVFGFGIFLRYTNPSSNDRTGMGKDILWNGIVILPIVFSGYMFFSEWTFVSFGSCDRFFGFNAFFLLLALLQHLVWIPIAKKDAR